MAVVVLNPADKTSKQKKLDFLIGKCATFNMQVK